MGSSDIRMKLTKDEGVAQTSYRLPHLVHTARTYPVPSPNGSSVIVYGHANGVRILWRGGKPLKASLPEEQPRHEAPQSNGPDKDAIMIIDSDDEEAAPPKPETHPPQDPSFEDDPDEIDPSKPGPPIIQHLDIVWGVDVLDISFPPFPARPSFRSSRLSDIASTQLVIAAGCADHQIRVINLPLLPPSSSQKTLVEAQMTAKSGSVSAGSWQGQLLTLGVHGGSPSHVAATFTPRSSGSGAEGAEDEARGKSDRASALERRRSSGSSRATRPAEPEWDLLAASISTGNTPVLLVYRIPVSSPTSDSRAKLSLSASHTMPIQTQHLPSVATSLSFNPSLHPAERHSHLLLVDLTGCVRVYDCCPRTPTSASQSPTRQTAADGLPAYDRGSWMLSLYANFATSGRSDGLDGVMAAPVTKRKRIIDAKWVLGGNAIIALLSDGQWGLWDIEGAGPTARKGATVMKEVGRNSIKGGATTAWNLQGRMTGTSLADTVRHGSGGKGEDSLRLIPRTPRTRRTVERNLFGAVASGHDAHLRGGITVRAATPSSTDSAGRDTIVFWFDDRVAVLPDLWSYWENQVARQTNGALGNLLEASAQSNLVRLDHIAQRGQTLSSVDVFAWPARHTPLDGNKSGDPASASSAANVMFSDLLLARGYHLVVVSSEPSTAAQNTHLAMVEFDDAEDTPIGDLAVEDIGQTLNDMERRRQSDDASSSRRRVAFAAAA